MVDTKSQIKQELQISRMFTMSDGSSMTMVQVPSLKLVPSSWNS